MRKILLTLLLCTGAGCSLVGYEEQSLSAATGDSGAHGGDNSGANLELDGATTAPADAGSTGPGTVLNDGSLPSSDRDASDGRSDAGGADACGANTCPGGQQCNGGSCTVGCDPTKSTCDLDCANAEKCDARCDFRGTCDVDCNGAKKCDVVCAPGTTCLTVCTGADDCSLSCAADSACAVDCRNGANCNGITCAPSAICQMKCDKTDDNCAFAVCAKPKVCPSENYRVVVCNQECPQ